MVFGFSGAAGADGDVAEEAVGAGVCCEESGTAANSSNADTSTRWKQHFRPMHFIGVSAPLALDSTVGDRRFVAQDYTRGHRASQFEIFIPSIRFSDAASFLHPGCSSFRVTGLGTLCISPASV